MNELNETEVISRSIQLEFPHRVLFSEDVFALGNGVLAELIGGGGGDPGGGGRSARMLVFADAGVVDAFPGLGARVRDYCASRATELELVAPVVTLPGGEAAKNDWALVERIWDLINRHGVDRHSYVLAIGGGAVLDLVGFAAATAHRGIRHIRMPTTTLSQGDGGVGVKNGVNHFGKKNWVGTFSVPFAVINDFRFIRQLPDTEKRAGIIEAIKVALIRDRGFFEWIEANLSRLRELEDEALRGVVRRSAELHVDHIATSGDPFETGSARPLDFGHWAAHKLEQISGFELGHGEAVGMGMAVDLVYSASAGILDADAAERVLRLIEGMGFEIYSPHFEVADESGRPVVLQGLDEFREHLGGQLTITLVPEIGRKIEVHEMDESLVVEALRRLSERAGAASGECMHMG